MRIAESRTVIFSSIGKISSKTIHLSKYSRSFPMHTKEFTLT